MNRILSVILCAALCVTLAGSTVTVVLAAIQVTRYLGFDWRTAWAAAIAVVLPLASMTALGVWLVIMLIREMSNRAGKP